MHLALLRVLLRPVFGRASHPLIHNCARRTDSLDQLVDALSDEFADSRLGTAFGEAARLALVVPERGSEPV